MLIELTIFSMSFFPCKIINTRAYGTADQKKLKVQPAGGAETVVKSTLYMHIMTFDCHLLIWSII